MHTVEILRLFDQHLAKKSLYLDAVVVGGAALNMLGIVSRYTKDCDILYPEIPKDIGDASRAFAAELRQTGESLQDDWLNNGPASLVGHLRPRWQERLQTAFTGTAIHLHCLGRSDFLCAKLFALCDRGIDLGDCLALAPTAEEIEDIHPWLDQQDAHPDWPAHIQLTLADLAKRLGHDV
jgi:hypothetical protein